MSSREIVEDTWSGGTFTCPSPGVHIISSTYGKRIKPTYGASTYHKGFDKGKKVVSAENGTVITSGKTKGPGNYIEIKHKNNLVTRYLHLYKRYVKKGAKVKRGQIIALSGDTGISTGPHLHFEVQKNGTPVTPTSYLNMP